MRTHTKLTLTTLAATAILALAVSSAFAGHFRTSEKSFELIWNNALSGKTKLSFTAAGNTFSCNMTLLGGFTESTILKRTGINQGTIRHGELEACTGGGATIKTETMPWNLRYNSFTGTLPRIRGITTSLIGMKLRFETGSLGCEPITEANHPLVFILGETSRRGETGFETTGEPENITIEEGDRIPLRGEFFCNLSSGESEFRGVGLIRNLPQTSKIRITLI